MNFPAQPHMTDGVQGPLVIDGTATAVPGPLPATQILPGERNTPPTYVAPPPYLTGLVSTLNVFNDGQPIGVTGHMGAIPGGELTALNTLPINPGSDSNLYKEIDGLNMGSGLSFSGPNAPNTGAVGFAGGITYGHLDVVDVLLGNRLHNGTFGLDNDPWATHFNISDALPNAITLVQGGGGDKKITVSGGGAWNAPLVVFGNTSQDGHYYDSTTSALTGRGRVYTSAGQSVIDGSTDPNPLVIYGGPGNSLIYGSAGGDQIAGGGGLDTIYAGSGNDIIRANDGFNLDLTHPMSQVLQGDLPALTVVHDFSASDSPTGDLLYPTSDQIFGGPGRDIVLLSHGEVDQTDNPLSDTVGVIDAYTVDSGDFGSSSFFGALNSSAIVLAGSGIQTVDVGHTNLANLVVKNGYVYFSRPDGWIQHLSKVGTVDPGYKSNLKITTGNGNDIIVAGPGQDTITGGDGDKIILGDDGELKWSGGVLSQIFSQDETVSLGNPRANTITLGNGNDIVFGGSGTNTITLGNGNDIVAPANGQLDFDASGTPTTFETVFPTSGANNQVTLGSGAGVLIGGPGQNAITGGANYLIIPSNGQAAYDANLRRWVQVAPPIVSQPPTLGTSPAPTIASPPVTQPVGQPVTPSKPKPGGKPKHKKGHKHKKKPTRHPKPKGKGKGKPKGKGKKKGKGKTGHK
jgi:hypothetical protein